MHTPSFRAVLIPATIALALTACGGSDTDSAPVDTAAPAAEEATEEVSEEASDNAEGSDAEESEPAAGATDVNIKDSRYDPSEIDVAVGDTVTFTNSDAFAHTVTSPEDQEFEFSSGEFKDGETFELTFDEAGTFAYFCEIHPTMKGTVNVG